MTAQGSLAEYLVGLTFHKDDVPEFGIFEARETLVDLLVEFGFEVIDSHRLAGTDSAGIEWVIWVGPFGSIEVSRNERAMPADLEVQFRGEFRVTVPAALAYLASVWV